jgi:carotenoid cleavage dioxygenase-like enzyme
VVDLGRVDTRFMSLEQRYGFTGFADAQRPFDEARAGNLRGRVTNSYGRFDFTNGKLNSYFAGPTHSLQECCFVPRAGSTEEGDGYLIGVAQNYAEMRSELIIADARNLEAGDIARVMLPFRTSAQVHGLWATDAELALS